MAVRLLRVANVVADIRLRKSVRVYRALLVDPKLRGKPPEHPDWREVAAYLRALYREYGRANVRAALEQHKS
jgi:hypothetical protein